MRKPMGILALSLSLILLSGCAGAEPLATAVKLAPGEHAPVAISTWITSWDKERGEKEYKKIRRHTASLSCFMAYYDHEDKLFVPEETKDIASFAKKQKQAKRYLSVTNDWRDANGKSTAKDKELLRRLLKDAEGRKAAAAEMIAAVRELDCTGLELDYEAFFKDEELLGTYLEFAKLLAAECQNEGLDLRIVLEPRMPMDAGLPEGPEYVVMFYNLYGTHGGPGPKADGAFIQKTIKKMEALPGKKAAAFATGGCVWEDYGLLGLKKGKAHFIEEEEAVELTKKFKITPQRDENSYALHFEYEDQGHNYEVWYADSETLNAWIKAAADGGITAVNIWRLGGNIDVKGIKNK